MTTVLPIIARNDSAMEQRAEETTAHERERDEHTNNKSLALTVLGMCSGASLDGVGCVLLRYNQRRLDEPLYMELLEYGEIPIPLQTRTQILNLLRGHIRNLEVMTQLHSLLGQMLSTVFTSFCSEHDIAMESIDLIAAQADSILPAPLPSPAARRNSNVASSLDGWTTVVASKTGITATASIPIARRPVNLINAAAGPSPDTLLLQHPTSFRVCLTINDIAVMSIIPPSGLADARIPPSANCGPGTMFIDYTMRYATSNQLEHDRDGSYGARGQVNMAIVDRFLDRYDYARRSPPMTIAVEMFGNHEAQSVIDECLFLAMSDHDTVATMTHITAENLVRQYRRLMAALFPDRKVDEIFVCGPGARNNKIVDHLESALPQEVITRPLDDIGIPGDAKDAVCCAQVGLETILRHASLDDGTLEAEQRRTLPGGIVAGRNWEAIRKKVVQFNNGNGPPTIQRIVVERHGQRRPQ